MAHWIINYINLIINFVAYLMKKKFITPEKTI